MSDPHSFPHRPANVSALFYSAADVDRALSALSLAGLPRDLIDVVVSPKAALRFYRGRAQVPKRETLRYAAIGGLVGLTLGGVVALALLATGTTTTVASAALIQLLGPNLTTVLGAGLGAAVGAFVQRPALRKHARAASVDDAVVVVVVARAAMEAEAIAGSLARAGGRDIHRMSASEA
ncbi:MAG: hypothetical protein NVS1B4_26860 [Gemmatimonadaceae bacterium]